ncbi:MAG: phage tail tape measure protein [Anaerovibrio sp.]|uniref:phage tail tape measure protein n=1 Tax=Anaerovibrio sp. TaxID=1872532 RepID=UPI002622EC7F|nr:phage tail tape measure protein [Anaerovibrio sp.]MDD7677423.1 phage tail tape measure protein [Anaerovibrio sp.]MDY2603545.1 phage tail tape measure protein [Anaerovibrio sp.]
MAEFVLSAVLELKDKLTANVKNARREMGGLSSSAADVSASLKNTGVQGAKAMSDISSSAGKTLQDIKNVGLQGTIALEQTVKAAEQASAAARKAGDSVSSIQKPAKVPVSIGGDAATKLQGIRSRLDELTKGAHNVLVNVKTAGAGAVNSLKSSIGSMVSGAVPQAMGLMGIGMGIADTVNTYKNFQAQMSTVQAISGASAESMKDLTAKAKEMGATTQFSATEAGQAMQYMAMAGWENQQMIDGIGGVMNLAGASGESLARVSDIVTDALSAFGLKAGDSGHFADVLAAATSKSNTSVGLMGETFKYVAPIAGAMKYSIEDTSLAIGLMANSGIKGSEAGTALRSTLTRLVKPPKEAAAALGTLGISAVKSDGTIKPLRQSIFELRSKFKGLTDAQKTQFAASIAGQEAMSGFLAIMNESDENFSKLANSIDKAKGKAEEMNKIKNDNLAGDVKSLQSAWESLQLTIMEGGQGTGGGGPASGLRGFVTALKEDVDLLQKSLEDGLDISDVGKLSLNVVSQLYEKFKALDGVGSLLAGGALAAGLYKIVSLSKKAAGSLAGLAGKGAGGIGNKGTGLPGLPGSIGSMTVNAANVVVNGKGVAGGDGLSDMPGTPDVPGTEGKGSKSGGKAPKGRGEAPKGGGKAPKGGGEAPKGGKLGGFKNVAKGLLKGASKYAIPLEIASVGLDYYNANKENEQASWGAGYQLSEAKKQVASSTDALYEAKSRGASADEINYLQKQHQDAVADMSQAQQYADQTEKYNANRMNGATGSAIGGVAGGLIGGAIGSFIAPGVGSAAGAAIGGVAGSAAGDFIGQNFNDWSASASEGLQSFRAEFDNTMQWAGNSFRGMFEAFGNGVDNNMQYVADGFSNNFEYISAQADGVGQAIATSFENAGSWIDNNMQYVADSVSNNFEYLKGCASDAGAGISQFMADTGASVEATFQSASDSVNSGWDSIRSGAGSLADSLYTMFDDAIASVKSKFSDLAASASSRLASAGASISAAGSRAYSWAKEKWNSFSTGTSYFSVPAFATGTSHFSVPAFSTGTDYFRAVGGVPSFAVGTNSYRSMGLAQINEHGGELVQLPDGSRVFPTAETQQIINRSIRNGDLLGNMYSPSMGSLASVSVPSAGGGGSSAPVVNITGNSFSIREEADIEKIAHAIVEQFLLAQGNFAGC